MNHAQVIRAQILELEAEVQNDPRLVAISHLKAALAAIEGVGAVTSPSVAHTSAAVAERADMHGSTHQPAMLQAATKRAQFFDTMGEYIDMNGPTHRAVLTDVMVAAGIIDQNNKNPLNAFATRAYEFRHIFESDGKGTFWRRAHALENVVRKPKKRKAKNQREEGQKDEAAQRSLADGF